MPGGLAERVQAVIHGAAAALPRELRYHLAARPDAKTLDRLTTAMTAWARGAGADMASFAGRFFGRSADDPIVAKLWAAATLADRAGSHADLGVAATDLADAQQLIGLNRWPRFVADAGQRASDVYTYILSEHANGKSPDSPLAQIGGGIANTAASFVRTLSPVSTAQAAELYSTPTGIKFGDKIQSQMPLRGFTRELIDEAVGYGERVDAINKASGGPATRYISPTTGSRL